MKRNICFFIFTLFITLCSYIVLGNPIPVNPDPTPVLVGVDTSAVVEPVWIGLIFVIDFFFNLLILYGALYILDRFSALFEEKNFTYSTRNIISAALLISIVGIVSEVFLGGWYGGLLIVLFIVFLSYMLVSRFIFHINLVGRIRIGCIALIVNFFVWLVVFSI